MLGNLFRDQLDRYGELERLADEWAELVAARDGRDRLRPQRRRPADRRPRPRPRAARAAPGVTYFGIEDPTQALPELQHAFDAKHCRRCGAPVPLRARLRRAPRPLRVPQLRRRPPGARRRRDRRSSCTACAGSRVAVTHPGGRARARAAPPRPLQRLQRARRDRRGAAARASPLERDPRRRSQSVRGRVRPGRDDRGRGQAGLDPADQEPGRRERGAAHAAARGRRTSGLDLWIALNDRIADGRDVSWIWDADFELLAGGVRRVVCAGTRAPEMALRLKYAGSSPRTRSRSSESIERSLDARRRRRAGPPLRPAHLHRPARAAHAARRARPGGGVLAMSELGRPRSIWHEVECGAYARRPGALGASSPTRPAGPVLELGCGTGRVALHLAGARASR